MMFIQTSVTKVLPGLDDLNPDSYAKQDNLPFSTWQKQYLTSKWLVPNPTLQKQSERFPFAASLS